MQAPFPPPEDQPLKTSPGVVVHVVSEKPRGVHRIRDPAFAIMQLGFERIEKGDSITCTCECARLGTAIFPAATVTGEKPVLPHPGTRKTVGNHGQDDHQTENEIGPVTGKPGTNRA